MDGRGEVQGIADDGSDLHHLPLGAVPGAGRAVVRSFEPGTVAVVDVRGVIELIDLDDVAGCEAARIGYRDGGRVLGNVSSDVDGASPGGPQVGQVDRRHRAGGQRGPDLRERGSISTQHDALVDGEV